jgi:hypothetical protein
MLPPPIPEPQNLWHKCTKLESPLGIKERERRREEKKKNRDNGGVGSTDAHAHIYIAR